MRISDWSSDVCSSDLVVTTEDQRAEHSGRRDHRDDGLHRELAVHTAASTGQGRPTDARDLGEPREHGTTVARCAKDLWLVLRGRNAVDDELSAITCQLVEPPDNLLQVGLHEHGLGDVKP